MRSKIAALAASLVVVACGSTDPGPVDDSTPAPDSVLLTVTSEGGFVPVEFNLDRFPRFQLMADGRLFFQGPVPAIYPGPLMPNVEVTTMEPDLQAEVLRLVDELGLADIDERIDDSGAEMIADAATDFITFHDGNGAHRLGIYALGLDSGASQSPERILATELVEVLGEAVATGEATTYQADRLQVATGPGVAEPGMSQVEPWPFEFDVAAMPEWGAEWRCTSVEGEQVSALVDTFKEANQATLWDTGTAEVSLRVRPLLPAEAACEGAPQG